MAATPTSARASDADALAIAKQRRGPAERTHSGVRLALLYPLHPKIGVLRRVPVPVRRRTRRALTATAVRAHLRRCRATTFIGVTGSYGKTTTKDLLAHMAAAAGPTAMTHHNDNGVYGVPASLLSVRPSDRFAAIELGILERPGEMRWMASLFRPSVAVLTGIDDDHLSSFGSRTAIAREKRALLERLPGDGVAVVNGDDALARQAAAGLDCRTVFAGRAEGADVRLLHARAAWPGGLEVELAAGGRRHELAVALHGTHQARLVALAFAAALACGVSSDLALAGASHFEPRPGRLCPAPGPRGSTFLLDDFKSRLPGATAALQALRAVPAARRIAVLGELQDRPPRASAYAPLAQALADAEPALVVALGAAAEPLGELLAGTRLAPRLVGARDSDDAAAVLAGRIGEGDVVLLHGPVGQGLRDIATALGPDARVPHGGSTDRAPRA